MPTFTSNACAGFPPAEQEKLWKAAKTLADSERVIGRIVEIITKAAETIGGRVFAVATVADNALGVGWRELLNQKLEETLWNAMDVATLGLNGGSDEEPWTWFSKAVTTASGAISGLFGLPGALVDVPITTLLIMRSIADIARAHGEDLASEEVKQACLQVFALGNPTRNDDEPDVAYWGARLALAALPMEMLIRTMASRLSVVFADKLITQAVPVVGAMAGGGLNYMFMGYYQDLATVHFTIRELERRSGDGEGIRACFDNLVRQARSRNKRSGDAIPAVENISRAD